MTAPSGFLKVNPTTKVNTPHNKSAAIENKTVFNRFRRGFFSRCTRRIDTAETDGITMFSAFWRARAEGIVIGTHKKTTARAVVFEIESASDSSSLRESQVVAAFPLFHRHTETGLSGGEFFLQFVEFVL
jgi:hypothetical protein